MMLLWSIDIEILETDNLAVGLWQDLTHIAVKSQFAERIWIQRILTLIPLAEAMFAAAIG